MPCIRSALAGAYLNFIMEEGEDRIRATYRGIYDRLAAIKAKYDPGNFFRVNKNIRGIAGLFSLGNGLNDFARGQIECVLTACPSPLTLRAVLLRRDCRRAADAHGDALMASAQAVRVRAGITRD